MVTSNKNPDKKVVKMSEHNTSVVVPQRTLLGEVNEHITCPLCRGYYIDATTIVECLHSFCRSCIIKHLQVKSYCPVCEMMINSAKPNIKLDKALQDIVYKLVPGLFQKEMERRQQFYASRPGPAATATPEQRGEDTERIIFSPEDVISFSLEYADVTDTDSISSKSSDSNEPQPTSGITRRYLQCPAVVNISHLKKFLSMKFDIDSTQFAIDILYKRVPLPDYYTLMDIAYIYNWKRNEPMRFFYQIIDYVAIRNRLFEINRKGSTSCNFGKSSPANTEDTNTSSPMPHLNDQGSEASSGTDSPMPDDNVKTSDTSRKNNKLGQHSQTKETEEKSTLKETDSSLPKKNDDDVEKSQFLNSFELTAKSNCTPVKSSPVKSATEEISPAIDSQPKLHTDSPKVDDKLSEPAKRKFQIPSHTPELKKLKIELEKTKITNFVNSPANLASSNQNTKVADVPNKGKDPEPGIPKISQALPITQNSTTTTSATVKDVRQMPISKAQESPGLKRTVPGPQSIAHSPKRKPPSDGSPLMQPPSGPPGASQKTVSPLKLQVPKSDAKVSHFKQPEPGQKPPAKKMPDLKPGIPVTQSSQNKGQPANKVRMDLLANNSDPTIDRSKILSQVKTSLGASGAGPQSTGDPLKSLFDSCKINIPSSLSITLTDQKLDPKNPGETTAPDPRKTIVNKNLASVSNATHKVPSPPVHNYIEILKLPDTESKKQVKSDGNTDTKPNPSNKTESSAVQSKPTSKSSETSAKGPIPNLKPISDTKLGKQSGNYSTPITFQQTFEQQLQSMQGDKKSKGPKNKAQVPKLVPATPKSLSTANKPNNPMNKPNTSGTVLPVENKPGAALDLSTPHTVQNQLGPQQTFHKAFETMQSIDNLAKKQNLPAKSLPPNMPPAMSQSNVFSNSIANRPLPTGISPLRIPSTSGMSQMKIDKGGSGNSPMNINRQDLSNNKITTAKSINSNSAVSTPGYQLAPHTSPSMAQPSPRSQTRSPSSSPKLVIAEEKQTNNPTPDQNLNQSNQITSTQLSNMNMPNNELSKTSPGPSKPALKPLSSTPKLSSIRQPITPNLIPNPTINSPAEYIMSQTRPPLMTHPHTFLRQMEMSAWIKSRQFDLFKNMSNMAHQSQNDFNNKDKQ